MIRRRRILAGLLAGLVVSAVPANDDGSGDPLATSVKGADLDLLDSVRRIAARVELVRDEAFTRPPLAVRVPEDMRRVAADIRAFNVLTNERLEARGRAWNTIGLGNARDPRALVQLLASDLEGVGFDSEGNRLLIAPDRLAVSDFEPAPAEGDAATMLLMTGVRPDEPLVGHMLTHVRQKERTGTDPLAQTTDRLLANMAWAEGEANLVALRYLFKGLGMADDAAGGLLDPTQVLGGALLPTDIESLTGVVGTMARFVYLDGFDAVTRRFRIGGWDEVSRAMAEGHSTSDVMHADRRLPPQTFGAAPDPGFPGLRLLDEDTLGEQAIFVMISWLTGKDNLALQAGDGWVADRLYRWESSGEAAGEGVTLWVTRWTSPEEAADFVYAYSRALDSRFAGSEVEQPGDGRRRLSADGMVFHVESSSSEVRVRVVPERWEPSPESGGS